MREREGRALGPEVLAERQQQAQPVLEAQEQEPVGLRERLELEPEPGQRARHPQHAAE